MVKAIEASDLDGEIYYMIRKFGGTSIRETILMKKSSQSKQINKKYNQLVVNRWHVLIRLNINKELIPYRRHNIKKKKIQKTISIIDKLKLIFSKKNKV